MLHFTFRNHQARHYKWQNVHDFFHRDNFRKDLQTYMVKQRNICTPVWHGSKKQSTV